MQTLYLPSNFFALIWPGKETFKRLGKCFRTIFTMDKFHLRQWKTWKNFNENESWNRENFITRERVCLNWEKVLLEQLSIWRFHISSRVNILVGMKFTSWNAKEVHFFHLKKLQTTRTCSFAAVCSQLIQNLFTCSHFFKEIKSTNS